MPLGGKLIYNKNNNLLTKPTNYLFFIEKILKLGQDFSNQ